MTLFNSPISNEKADRIINLFGISSNNRVLDAGCGRGEFLIRVIEATGAYGLGIDIDSECTAAASTFAAERVPEDAYEFRVANIQEEPLEAGSFDMAMCIGSTHAFGTGDAGYPNTLQSLSRLVRPGGHLLIGEGYWKQPPALEYLQLIGEPVGIYRDHAANISFAEDHDFIAVYAACSNEDEWDHFEWSHRMKIERQAAEHPDDPTLTAKLKRSRQWRDGYLRWGRSTMGFGFYLFMKPADPTR